MIDDRQRGAANGKSSALRMVCEPQIDELLEVLDEIEEREVDDCMLGYSFVDMLARSIYSEGMPGVNER